MLNLIHKKLKIYTLTNKFLIDEKYILSSQIKRATISVCSNLAEDSARNSDLEKKRFYEIARSSLVEVETQIEIALVLNYLSENDISNINLLMESIYKMLSKLISNLGNKIS